MRIFVTDGEGPISKNDNAQELAAHYIPNGANFFAVISKYDDFLADVLKIPGYKAGDTLKLIVPFLKAHGATDSEIRGYSEGNVLLVPDAKKTVKYIREMGMPLFLISTSYEPYVKALCEVIEMDFGNAYYTHLSLDECSLEEGKEELLKELAREISEMKVPEWPKIVEDKDAESYWLLEGKYKRHRETIMKLDEIFWRLLPEEGLGKMMSSVNPIGGIEKAKALDDILERMGIGPEDASYGGDSITDVQALERVVKGGGLGISFNGNEYPMRFADVAVISPSTLPYTIIAEVFNKNGKEHVLEMVYKWQKVVSSEGLSKFGVSDKLAGDLYALFNSDEMVPPKVALIDDGNKEALAEESTEFRKGVRGIAGSLG
jgi:energy-converting hydrogenase A subunit R